jgi:hypothetical protein
MASTWSLVECGCDEKARLQFDDLQSGAITRKPSGSSRPRRGMINARIVSLGHGVTGRAGCNRATEREATTFDKRSALGK